MATGVRCIMSNYLLINRAMRHLGLYAFRRLVGWEGSDRSDAASTHLEPRSPTRAPPHGAGLGPKGWL